MIRTLPCFIVLFSFVCFQSALAENLTTTATFELMHDNGQPSNALLMDTAISGEINGLVASITIEQTFTNTSTDWVNGRYHFPLPEMAAVNQFEVEIGNRLIKGIVQEKQQAKQTFEAAKQAGKKAGLLEQQRGNAFRVSVANIGPGQVITTRLTYVDRVRFDHLRFEYTLPTTFVPGPTAPAPILQACNQSQANADSANASAGAALVDSPQPLPAIESSHQFSLDLVVNPGIDNHGILSPSHDLMLSAISDTAQHVALVNGVERLDRDLVLQWSALDPATTQAALFHEYIEGEHYQMLMVLPPAGEDRGLPRDVTFIIDTSGSMGGVSIVQATAALLRALDDLTIFDRFNVIEFNSGHSALFQQSQVANANNLNQAREMVSRLAAGGGTDMRSALQFAFNQPEDKSYLQQIVFITDGGIGNQQQLFDLIRGQLGSARIFPLGIGAAPNGLFMSKAAKFGRGFDMSIRDLNEVQVQMDLFLQRLKQPMMRNIDVLWPHDGVQYPERVPDLYANEPLMVLIKSDDVGGYLQLSGELDGNLWDQEFEIQHNPISNAENLSVLWARAEMETLNEDLSFAKSIHDVELIEEIQSLMVVLGIKHNLVSPFTSFVAVEEHISRPEGEDARDESLANVMPQGVSLPAPNTATVAPLFQWLGLMLLLVLLLLHAVQKWRASTQLATVWR